MKSFLSYRYTDLLKDYICFKLEQNGIKHKANHVFKETPYKDSWNNSYLSFKDFLKTIRAIQ